MSAPTRDQIEQALLSVTSAESVLGFVRVDNAIRAMQNLLGSQPSPETGYDVIADRDRGDDPVYEDTRDTDRVTVEGYGGGEQIIRIERPKETS
jgi:hypothetical protein